MHVFTLAVPSCAASCQMSQTDSVSFLRVPQHTKFNLLCVVPIVATTGDVHFRNGSKDGGEGKTSLGGWGCGAREREMEMVRRRKGQTERQRRKRERGRERGDPVTWNHHHGAGEER